MTTFKKNYSKKMTTAKGLKVSVTVTISKRYNKMLSSLFYFLGGMFFQCFQKLCQLFSFRHKLSFVLSELINSVFVSANSFASLRASSDKYSGAENRFPDSAK